jgi:hypothetical protein
MSVLALDREDVSWVHNQYSSVKLTYDKMILREGFFYYRHYGGRDSPINLYCTPPISMPTPKPNKD